MHAFMRKSDLVGFNKGQLFQEKIINLYFKILEKMNLVQLSMDNYTRQMLETPDPDRTSSNLLSSTTMKIQYLNTNFVRKLLQQSEVEGNTPFGSFEANQIDQNLMQYFNHDLVLLPFFFDSLGQNPQNDNHKHLF